MNPTDPNSPRIGRRTMAVEARRQMRGTGMKRIYTASASVDVCVNPKEGRSGYVGVRVDGINGWVELTRSQASELADALGRAVIEAQSASPSP